jgi:integrase
MSKIDEPLWTKMNGTNLYRHKNGRYYARVFVSGKEIWKSLKTTTKSTAEERLEEHVRNARKQRASGFKTADGKLSFGDVVAMYRANFLLDAELAENTKNFREAGVKLVLKTWPGVGAVNVRKITIPMVREWALNMRAKAQPYVPIGAKRACRNSTGASPTTFNCALDALRHTLDIAVEAGHLFTNPARDKSIKRATPKKKRMERTEMPSREEFQALIKAIESAGTGDCKAAAEMVRFLAYTGARKTEANNVLWRDVDFVKGRVTLRVTKNGDTRDVPMIPECRTLLEAMRASRPDEAPEKPVLRVKACLGFLETACKEVGVRRMGHHSLRHLFATTAIEAGIDTPTVAKIMGHKDGGALAMKVYGHLRDEHAQAAMQKMSFSCG